MSELVKLYTIGFTKRSAEDFFSTLQVNSVRAVIDTRLNNVGQLAGFSKRDDLKFFSQRILSARYEHLQLTAPTEAMLKAYKSGAMSWASYADEYRNLLETRRVSDHIKLRELDHSCLLCSEHSPQYCHRRILAEYLAEKFSGQIEVQHL